jgi:hypothetical protein
MIYSDIVIGVLDGVIDLGTINSNPFLKKNSISSAAGFVKKKPSPLTGQLEDHYRCH